VICCTTCAQPKAGDALHYIAEVLTHPNPGSMEDFRDALAELRSLNSHHHELAPES